MSESRIGKLPIKLPPNVDIKNDGLNLEVNGKFGKLILKLPSIIEIDQKNDYVYIITNTKDRKTRSLHGLYRSLINNMIIGVSKQFVYVLKLTGVGYRGAVPVSYTHLTLPTIA